MTRPVPALTDRSVTRSPGTDDSDGSESRHNYTPRSTCRHSGLRGHGLIIDSERRSALLSFPIDAQSLRRRTAPPRRTVPGHGRPRADHGRVADGSRTGRGRSRTAVHGATKASFHKRDGVSTRPLCPQQLLCAPGRHGAATALAFQVHVFP